MKEKERKRGIPRFRVFYHYLKYIAAAAWILSLANIPINLLAADWMSGIVTSATEGRTKTVVMAGLELLALLVGFRLFETLSRIYLERAKSKALQRCRMELYGKFLAGSLSDLYSSDSGQSKERLNDDFNAVTEKIISTVPGLGTGLITAAAYFLFIARLNLLLAVALTILSLLQILPPMIVKKYLERNYTDTRNIEAVLTNFILEAHHGFPVLKLYKLQKWYGEKLKRIHKQYVKIGNRSIWAGNAEDAMDEFLSTILKYGTYALAGLLILYGMITLDAGVKAIALSGSFFAAVNTIFSSIPRFAVIRQAQGRLSEWYDVSQGRLPEGNDASQERSSQQYDAAEDSKIPEIAGTGNERGSLGSEDGITLSDVWLSFQDKEIYHGVTAHFPSRGLCLIKGANGIGKSTLFKLMIGLIPAGRGSVRIDGMEPKDFSGRDFPHRIFYLPQEDAEFEFTPREFYGMISGIDPTRLNALTAAFQLDKVQLEGTKISGLSGGERKKVFLALALALDPALLFLDEPTNSLDEHSRSVLVGELRKRTGLTLLISHDPVFDAVCDCTYLVEKGGIALEAF